MEQATPAQDTPKNNIHEENTPQPPSPAIPLVQPSSQPAAADESSKTPEKQTSSKTWVWVLMAYLCLFVVTGYIAFIHQTPILHADEQQRIFSSIQDQESRTLISSLFKEEVANFKEKQSIATQSFHIILGGLMGFLSALGAGVVGRKS
ncbi:hypothetical protein [Spartinivicinus poritis]|uniref:Uncharacterized protein n=1 Tax=Spartinivicinus poritis TaxID=2994640 RepID=A0ABT5U3X6_9GAMM|nr:hypothetical protein [Spartinivicinus sp. A2-2]MDE1460681.1 hypothetical protein [Spartinivicinus sp. A2-2]